AVCDEISVWPTDDAADPDFEVLGALRPGLLTVPGSMLLGDEVLVWQASTRQMNPTVSQALIDAEIARDPAPATADYASTFRTAFEAFITREAVEACIALDVRAQQPAMPVVGFLHAQGQNDRPHVQAAFRRGLSEAGYVEGRNVAIEYRFAENQHDRLPALAADLAGRKVAVIAATGGGASVLAAMAATKTSPIVFTTGGDPVREGYVASLNRPGSNATGVSWFNTLVASKGIGLLQELVPNAAMIAVLVNPTLPESARMPGEAQKAARIL